MRRSRRRNGCSALLWLSILAACSGGSPAPQAEAGSQAGQPAADLIPGTPPGGLAEWVADIQNGIQTIPTEAASDPAAAQKRALDLYVGRQEFIELYYGENGRLAAGQAQVGTAVADAETRFHDLLVLLSAPPPADTAKVREAVAALANELDRVLREARAAGVPLVPPGQAANAGALGGGAS
ncbi:MAG TPA: hypothetical protein VIL13_03350 [Longimicrobiales bacterium]